MLLNLCSSEREYGLTYVACVRKEKLFKIKFDKVAEEMETYVQKKEEVEWANTAAEVARMIECVHNSFGNIHFHE